MGVYGLKVLQARWSKYTMFHFTVFNHILIEQYCPKLNLFPAFIRYIDKLVFICLFIL